MALVGLVTVAPVAGLFAYLVLLGLGRLDKRAQVWRFVSNLGLIMTLLFLLVLVEASRIFSIVTIVLHDGDIPALLIDSAISLILLVFGICGLRRGLRQ